MIDVKELRIGNYVKFLEESKFNILQVDLNDICNIESDIEGVFEPIKLTKEWLIKFGFKEILNPDTYWNAERIYIYREYALFYDETKIYNLDSGDIYYDISYQYRNGHGIIKNIDYVHQLQNLYFALTGKELTIKK